MKQLQWDKLPQQQVGKTLWNADESLKEEEMLKKLQMDGVWMEMEEDFKAKQLVINLMGKRINIVRLLGANRIVQLDKSGQNFVVFWTRKRRNELVCWFLICPY